MIDVTHHGFCNGTWRGARVRYQTRHMARPREGAIVGFGKGKVGKGKRYVNVLFDDNTVPEACRPEDLFWPPKFLETHVCDAKGHVTPAGHYSLAETEEDEPSEEDQP